MKHDDVKWDEISGTTLPEIPAEGNCRLPNGCTLYWKTETHGGRVYFSDECGGGVAVWDTAIVSDSTLLAALTQEASIQKVEQIAAERKRKEKPQREPTAFEDFVDSLPREEIVNDDDEYIQCSICYSRHDKCKCGSYYR